MKGRRLGFRFRLSTAFLLLTAGSLLFGGATTWWQGFRQGWRGGHGHVLELRARMLLAGGGAALAVAIVSALEKSD